MEAAQEYDEGKKRVGYTCLCRFCSENPVNCRHCGKVAYTGPKLATETFCMLCGWACKECAAVRGTPCLVDYDECMVCQTEQMCIKSS
jgi:hypothetical protein